MRCNQLMESRVLVCRATDGVVDVARIMRDEAIGFVPVCDEQGRPIGVVTDRDFATRVLAEGRSIETTCVADIMSPLVITCGSGDDLEVAEQMMVAHQKGRIVCTSLDGRVVGIISLSDVFEVESPERSARIFRAVASREAMIVML